MATEKMTDPMLHIKLLMLEEDGHAKDPVVFDEDGHLITACLTHRTDAGRHVDVFVQLDTPPKDAALTLRKIADWVERSLMEPDNLAELKEAMESNERSQRDRRSLNRCSAQGI
jgi:hypothetical protein